MKRTLKVTLVMLVVAAFATSTWAAHDIVRFSTSNTDPGVAPAGGTNMISLPGSGSQTLYLWVTDGILTGPGNPQVTPSTTAPGNWVTDFPGIPNSSAGFSYNLGVTSGLSNMTLTVALLNHPVIMTGGGPVTGDTDWDGVGGQNVTRWNAASSFLSAPNVTASSVTGLNGSSIPVHALPSPPGGPVANIQTGLSTNPAPGATSFGYNASRNAFLLGSVTFTVNSGGMSTLAVQPGNYGILTGNETGTTGSYSLVNTDLSSQYALGVTTLTFASARPGDISTNGVDSTPAGNVNANDINKM